MDTQSAGAAPARVRKLPSWLLTQTAMHCQRLVASGMAAAGARGYHYRVLAALDEFGPASQAELGRRSGIHFSDIVATINELAERGQVERSPDPADRRRNTITITPGGQAQLQRLDTQAARIQDELFAPLSAEERGELAGLLARLLDDHTRAAREGAG